jgi:hypothetical protein
MIVVRMVQTNKNGWRLETDNGTIILDDIILHSVEEARRFANAYISTWQSWDFSIITMEEK